MDIGTTTHMCNKVDSFEEFSRRPDSLIIGDIAQRSPSKAKAKGDMRYIKYVLFVLDLCKNLLSLSAITKMWVKLEFDENTLVMKNKKTDEILA